MQIIPVSSAPAQTLGVQLGGQACTIKIYQKSTGLFCDLYVADVLVIGGVACQSANRIVRDAYLGFTGDLIFLDTQGDVDPVASGLGSRWLLVYLDANDIAAGLANFAAGLVATPTVYTLMPVPSQRLHLVSAAGFVGSSGSAYFVLRDMLAAVGVTNSNGIATMRGSLALSAIGVDFGTGAAAMSLASFFAASGTSTTAGAASLRIAITFAAVGNASAAGSAGLSVGISLSAAGGTTTAGVAILAGNVALVAAGVTTSISAAMLTVRASLASSGVTSAFGVSPLTIGTAGMVLNAIGTTPLIGTAFLNDPNIANVSLLLHADGTNGSTTFVDSSPAANTVTANGTAAITTALQKWGSGSINVGNNRLTVPHSAALDFTTGDFTIELWFYSTSTAAQILIDKETGNSLYPWKMSLSEITAGKLTARRFNSAGTLLTDMTGTTTYPLNTWNFAQFTRSGDLFSLWLNGNLEASRTDLGVVLRTNSSDSINIGATGLGTGNLAGAIDDLRLTKGIVRGSSVPTGAFPNS